MAVSVRTQARMMGEGVGLLSGRSRDNLGQLFGKYSLLIWNISHAALEDTYLAERVVRFVFQEIRRSPNNLANEKKQSIYFVKLCREKIMYIQAEAQKSVNDSRQTAGLHSRFSVKKEKQLRK
ncbi:hypothetical protein [Domibacillus sp.]|uniref:hypothetical protein n=1 Tax=Domibacillus sp. TaxID=1969783 RepID=UPI002810B227|nr:hypothetical protein [Domibacillus sp.]